MLQVMEILYWCNQEHITKISIITVTVRTLQSVRCSLTTQDTSYISQTVIDGDSSGSVVTFENEEDSNSVLNGFTLKNGSGTYADPDSNGYYDYIGGGIYCVNSSPSLENVTIKGNSAHKGGGIYCYNSSPSLKNVTITGNCASDGGGIYCYESSPSLENVNIKGNSATGLFCFWWWDLLLFCLQSEFR